MNRPPGAPVVPRREAMDKEPKTLKEWFSLNPNHVCLLLPHPEGVDRVRAELCGGEGLDQRNMGDGDNEELAIADALRVRAAIRKELP